MQQGKKLMPIGRVGTGFPQQLLRWLEPRLKQLEVEKSPFSAPVPRKPDRTLHWVKPELVAGIEFTGWTGDGVLRQASLQESRSRRTRRCGPIGSICRPVVRSAAGLQYSQNVT